MDLVVTNGRCLRRSTGTLGDEMRIDGMALCPDGGTAFVTVTLNRSDRSANGEDEFDESRLPNKRSRFRIIIEELPPG